MTALQPAVAGHGPSSSQGGDDESSSWTTCSIPTEVGDPEDTAGSRRPAPHQGSPSVLAHGWAASAPGPPDEGVRTAWELGRKEVSVEIAKETMRIWRRFFAGHIDSSVAGARHAFTPVVQNMARDYLLAQLDEAVEELFAMGVEVGRFHLEGEDVENSDSGLSSGAGGHEYPTEDLLTAPQWWQ